MVAALPFIAFLSILNNKYDKNYKNGKVFDCLPNGKRLFGCSIFIVML